ncbi:tRNA pseudouridine38-40 synthase [Alteromonadaceae bacterium Bs31]|nr:tRNA pseudouridine38-40 synthase [Alteromonadaceae bacterium Bs31]
MSKELKYQRNIEIKPGVEFPTGMQRVALGIEYSGCNYRGFQKQKSAANTVQAELEKAISVVANEQVSLVCAGRTDAGVHATAQVVHFDTLAQRPIKAWEMGVNTHLSDAVRVCWAKPVGPAFHARFSAQARTYRYILQPSKVRSAILQRHVTWTSLDLDLKAMQTAAQALLGEHDFSAFRAAQCQAHSPIREVQGLSLSVNGPFLVLQIKANAFLHHMVRNIVGSLMEVGRGAQEPGWLSQLLEGRDRTLAAATASPHGLYLVRVDYPAHFDLPQPLNMGPVFLSETFPGR